MSTTKKETTLFKLMVVMLAITVPLGIWKLGARCLNHHLPDPRRAPRSSADDLRGTQIP
ncbi:MAG TPA: hypothetical protein VLH56_18280 [Dissulfurispiraceae bacterium]|nr:hypothetical protein [Dissulfurispiraceae bacterium]